MAIIDLTIVRGSGNKTLGTIQVELLTSEAEARNYGLYEINSQWYFITTANIDIDNFQNFIPSDVARVVSSARGFDAQAVFVTGVNIAGDENEMVRTKLNAEFYEDGEAEEPQIGEVLFSGWAYGVGTYGNSQYGGTWSGSIW